MPHNYSQFKNFVENKSRLDIKKYTVNSSTPTIVIHGNEDISVSIDEGKTIAEWLNNDLVIIQDTQHTFDSKQPWESTTLPTKLKEVCEKTLLFFREEKITQSKKRVI